MAPTATDSPGIGNRAVAYVRVSQAREGMVSPELQLTAIQAHCAQRGYQLTATLEDLDLSGRFWDRRQVEQAICLIEDGLADVLVVWRWSRVTRDRMDWAVAVNRVERAGGRLESATEAFDTTTSTGRLARGILAELSAFESERMGDVWAGVRKRRIDLGLTSHGQVMFGYRKRGNRYIRDRTTGPIVTDIYRRYTEGESFISLGRWLNDQRITNPGAVTDRAQWRPSGLSYYMDTGFAAGYIRHLGDRHPGAHKPLITEETWQAYLTRRAATGFKRVTPVDQFALTDLAHCFCGARMSPQRANKSNTAYYRCMKHPSRQSGLTIKQQRCDDLARTWLHALAHDAHTQQLVATELDNRLAQLSAHAAQLRTQHATAATAGRAELVVQLEATRQEANSLPVPTRLAEQLLADWDVLTAVQRRDRFRSLVNRIEVHNDLANPLLVLHTTWQTITAWTGIDPAPDVPGDLEHPTAGHTATSTATSAAVDPLQLLTPHEAALVAGVERQTIRTWWAAGLLPHTRAAPDGRSRLYAIGDLRKMRPRPRPRGGASTLLAAPTHSPSRRPRRATGPERADPSNV